jgi:hypothetical protein
LRWERGSVVAREASSAACQGGLLGRGESNLPNFPNFLGIRMSSNGQ